MSLVRMFDHIGITVADLDQPTAFFVSLGLEVEELGLRNVSFEVDDLDSALDRMAADGYGLVGGVGQFEHTSRMAHVRGPDGIIA